MYSDKEIDEAYFVVEKEVRFKQHFMIYQYLAYMVLTLIVLFITAKQEVGGIFNR